MLPITRINLLNNMTGPAKNTIRWADGHVLSTWVQILYNEIRSPIQYFQTKRMSSC